MLWGLWSTWTWVLYESICILLHTNILLDQHHLLKILSFFHCVFHLEFTMYSRQACNMNKSSCVYMSSKYWWDHRCELPFLVAFFWDRVSLCNSPTCLGTNSCRQGWPRTHRNLPASASLVLGLKAYTTTTQIIVLFLMDTFVNSCIELLKQCSQHCAIECNAWKWFPLLSP